ncbi:DNA-binding pseudobarrel domain-containing protein [Tanacetum coccineum]
MGWVAFKQRNNLSLGDECVFKYIPSEDKLCLAKVTKTSAMEADADPFFVVTITPSHKSMLWLPIDFAGLAGIDTKRNIIVKSLDGNETQMALRSCPFKKKQRYCFSIGWRDFKRSNNISEGDECVFTYITSEDKLCLGKVTYEKTPIRLPSPAEVVKRKRGRLPPAAVIKMTPAENVKMRSRRLPPVEITVAEAVKRKRGQPPPSSPRVAKDVKRKKGRAAV